MSTGEIGLRRGGASVFVEKQRISIVWGIYSLNTDLWQLMCFRLQLPQGYRQARAILRFHIESAIKGCKVNSESETRSLLEEIALKIGAVHGCFAPGFLRQAKSARPESIDSERRRPSCANRAWDFFKQISLRWSGNNSTVLSCEFRDSFPFFWPEYLDYRRQCQKPIFVRRLQLVPVLSTFRSSASFRMSDWGNWERRLICPKSTSTRQNFRSNYRAPERSESERSAMRDMDRSSFDHFKGPFKEIIVIGVLEPKDDEDLNLPFKKTMGMR
jgi:hypothetical protein